MPSVPDLFAAGGTLRADDVVFSPLVCAAIAGALRRHLELARATRGEVPAYLEAEVQAVERAAIIWRTAQVDGASTSERQPVVPSTIVEAVQGSVVTGVRAAGSVCGLSPEAVAKRCRLGQLDHGTDAAGRFTFRRVDLEAIAR